MSVTRFTQYKDSKNAQNKYRAFPEYLRNKNCSEFWQMKILTLFLALFLTLLPESAPFVSYSQGQDICLEEVDDVEEEAVIRIPQRIPKKILTATDAFSPEIKPASIQNLTFHLIHFCFERQWLKACLLRL